MILPAIASLIVLSKDAIAVAQQASEQKISLLDGSRFSLGNVLKRLTSGSQRFLRVKAGSDL